MTEVVVEVGPGTILGPNDARLEWVSAALECIDDDIALLGDRPVAVQDVWQDVMCEVAGNTVDTIVLVCPTWWPRSRIDRARAAARAVAATVVVLQRTTILRGGISDRRTTIVEIAPAFVVVSHLGGSSTVIPRRDGLSPDVEAVLAAVGAATSVAIDAPAGVDAAEQLGATIVDRLRATGIAATFTDEDSVRRAAAARLARQHVADRPPRVGHDRRGVAVLAGILSAVVLCGGFAMREDAADSPDDDMPMTLLVEGRVGLMVPAVWTVQRITSGPGSRRVQIVSPSDRAVVLHVTQSTGVQSSLAMTADALRKTLDEQPEGVFVDFNPSDRRAGKAASTYREIRPDHHVAWVVLLDGTVRIAIGCQSAPGREHLVRDACDQAIRSAHAAF